jgi:hypothetical protein
MAPYPGQAMLAVAQFREKSAGAFHWYMSSPGHEALFHVTAVYALAKATLGWLAVNDRLVESNVVAAAFSCRFQICCAPLAQDSMVWHKYVAAWPLPANHWTFVGDSHLRKGMERVMAFPACTDEQLARQAWETVNRHSAGVIRAHVEDWLRSAMPTRIRSCRSQRSCSRLSM